MDYEEVFKPIIISSIKNLAAMSITVDSFRFNRTSTEVQIHNMLRERLGGMYCGRFSVCKHGCNNNYSEKKIQMHIH